MREPDEILSKIDKFVQDYINSSQQRGKMYGTIEMLESNWVLLDHLYFILHGLDDLEEHYNFREFLISQGFGAKNAAMVIKELNSENPYLELNKMWNEYIEWRAARIETT
jgi:hypothetical protein